MVFRRKRKEVAVPAEPNYIPAGTYLVSTFPWNSYQYQTTHRLVDARDPEAHARHERQGPFGGVIIQYVDIPEGTPWKGANLLALGVNLSPRYFVDARVYSYDELVVLNKQQTHPVVRRRVAGRTRIAEPVFGVGITRHTIETYEERVGNFEGVLERMRTHGWSHVARCHHGRFLRFDLNRDEVVGTG